MNSEDCPKSLREMKIIDFNHKFIIVTVTYRQWLWYNWATAHLSEKASSPSLMK